MKSNKGITLVSLVIMIIVLLIIAGVSIGIGSFSMNTYQDKILESEAKELQTVIIEQYQKSQAVNDETLLLGEPCNIDGTYNLQGDYKLLDAQKLITLGMENPKDTYVVKYDTGEVINITTKTYSNGNEVHLKSNN